MSSPVSADLHPFKTGAKGTLSCILHRDQSRLIASFHLQGMNDALLNQKVGPTFRRDGLWSDTCLEVFISIPESERYIELNAAPSGDWNAYLFDAYRKGMRPAPLHPLIVHGRSSEPAQARQITLEADLSPISFLHGARQWVVGVSAVLKRTELEYWALTHLAERPDFHLRSAFLVRL